MAFDKMPDLGPMLLPGASEYAATCLALARTAEPQHRVVWDIRFGADPFQSLDIWMPKEALRRKLPVVVFLHGGALRNGHKEWIGCMAPAICGLPAVLVSPNYRLVPRVRVADTVDDAFAALAWVYRCIGDYGGDRERLFVGGHSAGGYLAALLALRKDELVRRDIPPGAIRGAFPVSGLYSMRKQDIEPDDAIRSRYWSEGVIAEHEAASLTPFNFVNELGVPFVIAWGDNDLPIAARDSARMVVIAREHNMLRAARIIRGCDHFAAHLHCTEAAGTWLQELGQMLRESR